MTHLNIQYEDFIDPQNLIKHFSDENEFREWCKKGTIQDLKCTLEAFEKAELYEICLIIKDEINKK